MSDERRHVEILPIVKARVWTKIGTRFVPTEEVIELDGQAMGIGGQRAMVVGTQIISLSECLTKPEPNEVK